MEAIKEFKNPWYDYRNELSPEYFKVKFLKTEDVMEFYEVLNLYQTPSVLAVIKLSYNRKVVVGQYVTLEGAIRSCFGNEYIPTW
jgi:hypothetical protein